MPQDMYEISNTQQWNKEVDLYVDNLTCCSLEDLERSEL